jgi:hypothetical protein
MSILSPFTPIAFGACVYRAGITRTGPRVRLREALAARR